MRSEIWFIYFNLILFCGGQIEISENQTGFADDSQGTIEFEKGFAGENLLKETEKPETEANESISIVSQLNKLIGNFFAKLRTVKIKTGLDVKNSPESNSAVPLQRPRNELEEDEDEEEEELVECNAFNLGFWPDKFDIRTYYKCEIDTRRPDLGNCVRNYYFLAGKGENKPDLIRKRRRYSIPWVEPCFLVSVMRCPNGFRYSTDKKVCIPDLIIASLPDH